MTRLDAVVATEPREPDYEAERRLPKGLSCAACVHASRCDALFGAVRRAFTSCDFWPSRFRSKPADTLALQAELVRDGYPLDADG